MGGGGGGPKVSDFFIQRIKLKIKKSLFFWGGGGGRGGQGARVSDLFTKIPNLKYFLGGRGGGRRLGYGEG